MRKTVQKRALFTITAMVATAVSLVFYAEEGAVFSHRRHIEEHGAECASCHTTGDSPALKKDACADCHDKALPRTRLPAKAKKTGIPFAHAIHENTAECADCHEATAKDKQKAGRPIQDYRRCVSCHEENGIEIAEWSCKRCHGENQKRVKPVSHKKTWRVRHGNTARWRFLKSHGDDCYLCHTRNECKHCHRTMKPRSHTALWRVRTHGLQASWDRERCKTCHETGSCINCHKTTAPMNHRGAWKSVHGLAAGASGERCKVCHSAAFERSAGCAECHGGRR
jgi:hypothetical protein